MECLQTFPIQYAWSPIRHPGHPCVSIRMVTHAYWYFQRRLWVLTDISYSWSNATCLLLNKLTVEIKPCWLTSWRLVTFYSFTPVNRLNVFVQHYSLQFHTTLLWLHVQVYWWVCCISDNQRKASKSATEEVWTEKMMRMLIRPCFRLLLVTFTNTLKTIKQ